MTNEEVQEWANEHKLDVMPINGNIHWRLLDNYGEYVLDVYFKKNKRGEIIRNSVLQWKGENWTVANTVEELKALI